MSVLPHLLFCTVILALAAEVAASQGRFGISVDHQVRKGYGSCVDVHIPQLLKGSWPQQSMIQINLYIHITITPP